MANCSLPEKSSDPRQAGSLSRGSPHRERSQKRRHPPSRRSSCLGEERKTGLRSGLLPALHWVKPSHSQELGLEHRKGIPRWTWLGNHLYGPGWPAWGLVTHITQDAAVWQKEQHPGQVHPGSGCEPLKGCFQQFREVWQPQYFSRMQASIHQGAPHFSSWSGEGRLTLEHQMT